MIYQHPLAYLVGLNGVALMRAWSGEFDEQFVRDRLDDVAGLLRDPALLDHPGVRVATGETDDTYRQWAATYDDPDNGLLTLDLPVIDEILAALPAGVAVDTACGTGRLAGRLLDRGHRVTGFDASEQMLEHARAAVPGADFRRADVSSLPVADASVDVLTNALALTHVGALGDVYAEFARVLRPGGTAIVSDVHPDLSFCGSVPKSLGADGEPQQAACHRHTVGDHLSASLAAGLVVRRFTELPPRRPTVGEPAPDAPVEVEGAEIGSWRDWPWTLLDLAPEAARAAWAVPSLFVWHFERPATR